MQPLGRLYEALLILHQELLRHAKGISELCLSPCAALLLYPVSEFFVCQELHVSRLELF